MLRYHGWKDPNDPLEQEFLQDLARYRQEDLERTLREYEQEDRRMLQFLFDTDHLICL